MRKNQRHQFVKPLKFYEHCINADLLCTCYVPGTSLVSGDRTPTETQPLPLGVRKTDVTIRICKGFPLALSPPLIHGPAIFFSVKGKIVNILAMRALWSLSQLLNSAATGWRIHGQNVNKRCGQIPPAAYLVGWLQLSGNLLSLPARALKIALSFFFFLSFL